MERMKREDIRAPVLAGVGAKRKPLIQQRMDWIDRHSHASIWITRITVAPLELAVSGKGEQLNWND